MKINIIRQNTLKYRKVKLIRRVNSLVTIGSVVLFFLVILFMSSQFVYLSFRQRNLKKEVEELTKSYNSRSSEVAEYVAVKEIAGLINDLSRKRFKYKEFLNGIFSLLPSRALLASVDFGAEGIVVASVRLSNLNDYDVLTANINKAVTDKQFLFSAISQKQLSRDKAGSYLITLELKIKNNG